ncbi:DUF917 family protein [Nocardioides insulae]|uniref:S-methyl thiohydantoin desulfurase domain-containing protein n=1 Tax=Nocardioides insulae TaxID=394734 RepID=UPI00048D2007|nr:DUF917 family protein [Nocardioides insulae]
MKRVLSFDDVETAVLGGAILGGGGGGLIEPGLATARHALASGAVELWSVDEFAPDVLAATVALVGAPAAPDPQMAPADMLATIRGLEQTLPAGQTLAAINTNENGSQTTINGWFHAAMSQLPVLDLACNGRAHPTGSMGALGLHREEGYVSRQAYAGGRGARRVSGVATGSLQAAAGVVRQASIEAGGLVAVARNPVSVEYAATHGAPGAISAAITLGERYLAGGVDAAVAHLGGSVVTRARVRVADLEQRSGLDVGRIELEDGTDLGVVNEYMTLNQRGARIADFPDLIMTFTEEGPIPSAHVRAGMAITVVHVPADRLLLSRTMFMPELYDGVVELLGEEFGPRPAAQEPAA